MQTFDLDIVDGVIIDLNAFGSQDVILQYGLVELLDLQKFTQNLLVILEFQQFFKLCGIGLVALADEAGDKFG